jgi:hypothetical protein
LLVTIFSTNQASRWDEKTKNAFHWNAWSVEIDQKMPFRSVGTFGGSRISGNEAKCEPDFYG